jgi:hypothetical protein
MSSKIDTIVFPDKFETDVPAERPPIVDAISKVGSKRVLYVVYKKPESTPNPVFAETLTD